MYGFPLLSFYLKRHAHSFLLLHILCLVNAKCFLVRLLRLCSSKLYPWKNGRIGAKNCRIFSMNKRNQVHFLPFWVSCAPISGARRIYIVWNFVGDASTIFSENQGHFSTSKKGPQFGKCSEICNFTD